MMLRMINNSRNLSTASNTGHNPVVYVDRYCIWNAQGQPLNSDPSDSIRRVVGDSAALANESLTAPLNVEMIEQEPGSR
jgi:hypothetical protein